MWLFATSFAAEISCFEIIFNRLRLTSLILVIMLLLWALTTTACLSTLDQFSQGFQR